MGGGVEGRKLRQLYLNNNKKCKYKENKVYNPCTHTDAHTMHTKVLGVHYTWQNMVI